MAYAVMLGLGDALAALVPPAVAVHFAWPDRLEVNGAVAGGIRLAWAPVGAADARAPWIVAGVALAIAAEAGREPGFDAGRTTLQDEGCGAIGAIELLEAFGRHLLTWVHRWQADGFGPLRTAYLNRAPGLRGPLEIQLGAVQCSGRYAGIDERGNLLLLREGRTTAVLLAEALASPSWSI